MEFLVTGGAGFVGSHLIEALLSENHSVVCLDDFSTGKKKNLETIRDKLELVEGDIRDPTIVREVVMNVDVVFHLAAQISVSRSVREPLLDASVNIEGTINLLEAIRNSPVKRFIYMSTGGAIYGEPKVIPALENTLENPISPYGLSKLVGERYLQWYHKNYGLSYSIIRPANIFGPRQDPLGEAGVISIFLGRIKNNQPLDIFGDGTDTRDYVYVKDIAEVCIKAMKSTHNDIFNAGTGKQTNVLELIRIIENVTKHETRKNFCAPRSGDVHHISLDSKNAYDKLGWKPRTDITTGISNTWEWFVTNH
ncbi:MAG: NAD-dependent epimerase/dehydratase family protein [Candidatus Heimdallarchaeota archaeon]|nr:MAG: NAD-dependent epimerase/dehydratase family protein [Candidatus Heimdallarchaeota archaeon]